MKQGKEVSESTKQAKESMKRIAESDLPTDANYRDYLRECITDIQKVVDKSHVGGARGEMLDAKLHAFGTAVEQEIERLATPYATDVSDILGVVPEHKEFLKEHIIEALRVHLVGFFRANQKDLSGTIFEDSIASEDQKRARSHYIQEFIANFLTHLFILGEAAMATQTGMKAATRLATRKMSDFTQSFFYGSYIHIVLQKAEIIISPEDERRLFTDAEKRDMLSKYTGSVDERIKGIGRNWVLLSDPAYISEHAGALPDPVFKVFSPGIRRFIALQYPNVSEGIRLMADNRRLLADTEKLRRLFEERHGIRITKGIRDLSISFLKYPTVVLGKDPLVVLARWLRGKLTLGEQIDSLRPYIIFEDLRPKEETQE